MRLDTGPGGLSLHAETAEIRYASSVASTTLTIELQRELVERWRETGRVLEARRHAELAGQSPQQSRRAAFDMLQLGGILHGDTERERGSGLIEMQRIFARWHSRGRN